MDDGGIDNGGVDTSDPQTFTIDVTPVNDAAELHQGTGCDGQRRRWAANLHWLGDRPSVPGAADESGQVLTFHVSTDNDALFSALPAIDSNGDLTFTSAADAFGSATVTVFLTDDGGTD